MQEAWVQSLVRELGLTCCNWTPHMPKRISKILSAMEACQACLPITNPQSLLKLHRVGDAIQPSHPLLSPSPPAFNLSQHQGLPMSQLFTSGGQSIGVPASASVLPINIQDWFPSGLTGWISLQSKGPSRAFSIITVQKYQFFVLSFLYSPTLTSIHDYWKNHSFDRCTFVGKVISLLFNVVFAAATAAKSLQSCPTLCESFIIPSLDMRTLIITLLNWPNYWDFILF